MPARPVSPADTFQSYVQFGYVDHISSPPLRGPPPRLASYCLNEESRTILDNLPLRLSTRASSPKPSLATLLFPVP